MGIFGKNKTIYLDNADSFSYQKNIICFLDGRELIKNKKNSRHKENLGKELTFLRKVRSKTTALSIKNN